MEHRVESERNLRLLPGTAYGDGCDGGSQYAEFIGG